MNEKPWHKKAAERIKMEVLIRIKSMLGEGNAAAAERSKS